MYLLSVLRCPVWLAPPHTIVTNTVPSIHCQVDPCFSRYILYANRLGVEKYEVLSVRMKTGHEQLIQNPEPQKIKHECFCGRMNKM